MGLHCLLQGQLYLYQISTAKHTASFTGEIGGEWGGGKEEDGEQDRRGKCDWERLWRSLHRTVDGCSIRKSSAVCQCKAGGITRRTTNHLIPSFLVIYSPPGSCFNNSSPETCVCSARHAIAYSRTHNCRLFPWWHIVPLDPRWGHYNEQYSSIAQSV
jgi:hypothetical protein